MLVPEILLLSFLFQSLQLWDHFFFRHPTSLSFFLNLPLVIVFLFCQLILNSELRGLQLLLGARYDRLGAWNWDSRLFDRNINFFLLRSVNIRVYEVLHVTESIKLIQILCFDSCFLGFSTGRIGDALLRQWGFFLLDLNFARSFFVIEIWQVNFSFFAFVARNTFLRTLDLALLFFLLVFFQTIIRWFKHIL